jgi:SAM-dependent methyltransferase
MSSIRPCSTKTLAEVTREWDQLAVERHRQIASGEDISFHHVVVPTVNHLLGGSDTSVVLDIGCGTGDFTVLLAQYAGTVIAIEPSTSSMAIARKTGNSAKNVRYAESSLEGAIDLLGAESATAAVAVMTLMAVPDIKGFAAALRQLLPKQAHFIAVLTHPWFWPFYWDYHSATWFHYEREIFIEAPFMISNCRSEFITTHIHRPLGTYINTFAEQGFRLDAMAEPMPVQNVQALYPKPWQFPRFLGMRWQRI